MNFTLTYTRRRGGRTETRQEIVTARDKEQAAWKGYELEREGWKLTGVEAVRNAKI